MIIKQGNLTIRNATVTDAEQLCLWWNDGKVMAHAGFPKGLNETPENIRKSLLTDTDETHRRHIIELDDKPIGEMNYRNKGNRTAEIGIKICDFHAQNKGYGTALLTMFIDALFTYYGYEKIILDTNVKNLRAQYVYEKKLGFRRIGVRENSWRNQLDELQSSIDYELNRDDWYAMQKEPVSYIHLRKECPSDYRTVEELVREAFWINTGIRDVIDEPLITHKLRLSPDFIPELDYVAEIKGKIVGHIIYSKAKIVDNEDRETMVLTFGPLSVLPEYQHKGVGRALMTYTIAEARRLGYRAIVIFGHPDYYPRFGFRRAAEFGLTTSSGHTFDPFMALELYPGALDGIKGKFFESPVFNINTEEAREFDKAFPYKEKLDPIPLSNLLSRLDEGARASIESLQLKYLNDLITRSEAEIAAHDGMDEQAIETIKAVMKEHGLPWGAPSSLS
ncbi:MAG TPA: GNAT family N-acetyltransferase [Clostridiales bacterium]|nr:GNAT family N-acetyltransferase [Clostridiales bacterium]